MTRYEMFIYKVWGCESCALRMRRLLRIWKVCMKSSNKLLCDPLPASPYTMGRSLLPPLIRGGLGWGYSKRTF